MAYSTVVCEHSGNKSRDSDAVIESQLSTPCNVIRIGPSHTGRRRCPRTQSSQTFLHSKSQEVRSAESESVFDESP